MSDRLTLSMWEPGQAKQAINAAWLHAKNLLIAGHRLVVEVRPEKRSDAQNRLLHATLSDIANQKEWAGAKRDVETWKRLLTAAWLRGRGEHVEVLPAIDDHGFDIVFRKTSTLTKAECSELTESVIAWAVDNGVRLTAPEGWQ